MKFTIVKTYENGSRDLECEFGHGIHVGHGIKDETLAKLSCYGCNEKAWHDAGKCAPDADWTDCQYCGEEKK